MYPSLRTAPKGSTDHLDLSTPTTSRCPSSSSARAGSGSAEERSLATTALRPGVTSRVSDGMLSAARISLMYSAALASFPGGLVVLIVSSCLSHLTASSETFASTLGDGCAALGACARRARQPPTSRQTRTGHRTPGAPCEDSWNVTPRKFEETSR